MVFGYAGADRESRSYRRGVIFTYFINLNLQVLYVNFELPAFAIEKRIREICGAMFVDVPENLIVWNLRGHAASAATILPMISQKAKAAGFTLIILDPLYKLLGERDENTSRDMTNLMNHVERLAVDTGAAVAFGSHYSKGNQSGKESVDRASLDATLI